MYVYIYIYIYIYTYVLNCFVFLYRFSYVLTICYSRFYSDGGAPAGRSRRRRGCRRPQKCTSKGTGRHGIVLKHRNSLHKSLCPVVICPHVCSSEGRQLEDRVVALHVHVVDGLLVHIRRNCDVQGGL